MTQADVNLLASAVVVDASGLVVQHTIGVAQPGGAQANAEYLAGFLPTRPGETVHVWMGRLTTRPGVRMADLPPSEAQVTVL